ncbi:hypothetical protein JCM18909A_10440 [Cutibacterium acnes subsp. elongatum]
MTSAGPGEKTTTRFDSGRVLDEAFLAVRRVRHKTVAHPDPAESESVWMIAPEGSTIGG